VGVVKRRVLRGLWRRLVGVGIIGPGLSGSGPYTVLAALGPLRTWCGPSLCPGPMLQGVSYVQVSVLGVYI
jgi:hypothetical protein